MPRPATFTADSFLDAAVDLFADGGARAVTMTAVAGAAGAPSGSIYHRFPDRASLLAALWRRSARGFEAAVVEHFGDAPSPEAAVEMAAFCVEWCRQHPTGTTVVLAGKRAFSPELWNEADRSANLAEEAERDRVIETAVAAVAAQTTVAADEVRFAMFDVPIAVVRRYALGGRPIPGSAADLARRLAGAILLAD